jgi:hypothetical protein
LNVLESPIVDFRELRSFLLDLDIEDGVFSAEIQRVVGIVRVNSRTSRGMVVPEFGGMLIMMIMMIVMVVMRDIVTLFSHIR